MKHFFKFFAITLAVSFMPLNAMASTWAESYDISWFDKNKSSFVLTTNKELAGIPYLVNNGYTTFKGKTIKLGNDIDLSGRDWVTIGINYVELFEGSFDGQGHTISGISIKYQDKSLNAYGFWGDFRGSSIRNTTFKGIVKIDDPISGSKDYYDVGGIVGRLARYSIISNCICEMDIYCNKSTPNEKVYVGGICGFAWESSKISYCSHVGKICASHYYKNKSNPHSIGGIAGGTDTNVKIEYCENISSEMSCQAPSQRGNITVSGIAGISNGLAITSYCRSIINNIEFDNQCAGTTWFEIGGIGSKSINSYSIINKINGNSVRMWNDVGGARYGGIIAYVSKQSMDYAKACFSNSDVSHDMPYWLNFVTQSGYDGNTSFSSKAMKTNNFLEELNVYSQIEIGKGVWTTDENGYPCIKETHATSSPGDTDDKIAINATNFPDENFRSSILEQGIRTEDDVRNAKILNLHEKGIESLKGIEFFTSLETLLCSQNKLTSLDVSKNTKLTLISCYGNNIHGANLDAFINSLPINNAKDKRLIVDDRMVQITEYPSDGLTTTQVAKAKERGWTPYYSCLIVYDDLEYEGYEEKPLSIDATNFPDENFRKYLLEQEFGKDGIVTPDEIRKIKKIYCADKGIRNLKGIECFIYLESLDCLKNQLSTLDVSKNTALENLACDQNQITSLNLTKNRALKTLWCNNNQLTYLDLSNNVALETLWCYGNQISTLDISNNTALIKLECQGNQLTSLDVSKNLALDRIWCDFNQLTSLDVSKNKNLTDLSCYRNKIRGGAMDDLVNSLPMNTTKEEHKFSVVSNSSDEGNVCTKDQVAIAKSRGWTPYCGSEKYEGSDPTAIDGVVTDVKDDVPIYNLNGQRMDKPRKGINIIGGKKVVVR